MKYLIFYLMMLLPVFSVAYSDEVRFLGKVICNESAGVNGSCLELYSDIFEVEFQSDKDFIFVKKIIYLSSERTSKDLSPGPSFYLAGSQQQSCQRPQDYQQNQSYFVLKSEVGEKTLNIERFVTQRVPYAHRCRLDAIKIIPIPEQVQQQQY